MSLLLLLVALPPAVGGQWQQPSSGGGLAPPPPGVLYISMFERLNSSVCYEDPAKREDISFPCRRKPGLVTLGNTSIAFAGWSLRRSNDGGRSFGPTINIPHADCAEPKNGVMVPDEQTQVLFFLVSCRLPSSAGLWILNSTDSGLSWSPVRNISAMAGVPAGSPGGRPPTAGPVPAIGGGIQTRSGRLLAQFYSKYCWNDPKGRCKLPPPGPFSPPPKGRPESTHGWCEANFLMMSDDHGITCAAAIFCTVWLSPSVYTTYSAAAYGPLLPAACMSVLLLQLAQLAGLRRDWGGGRDCATTGRALIFQLPF